MHSSWSIASKLGSRNSFFGALVSMLGPRPYAFSSTNFLQMFHIDFGHFLGNFKHKFGIKRERVRLVLSSDFVEVIKADLGGQKKNFERFRDLCEKTYVTIRRHGCLVISLLAMMISTGLPELSSEQVIFGQVWTFLTLLFVGSIE